MKKVLGALLLGATIVSAFIAYSMYTNHSANIKAYANVNTGVLTVDVRTSQHAI
ncbi:hypothetical protein [Priestia megaterium]|uniref:hypothetical protein n=1 Tax=Priestia megaterium TaxID=1404 RepID=UPI002E23CFD1|nr:hypothetical protein [Priestia megaterium]